EAQMAEIGTLLKKEWNFVAAFREVIERLTPDDEIRALHTRAVENGENWCLLSVGNFGHVVVWEAEKDRTLAKVNPTSAFWVFWVRFFEGYSPAKPLFYSIVIWKTPIIVTNFYRVNYCPNRIGSCIQAPISKNQIALRFRGEKRCILPAGRFRQRTDESKIV